MNHQIPSTPGAYLLIRDNVIIYVGHTDNLARRYQEWHDPDNVCVKRSGWDSFRYFPTTSILAAQGLEREYYRRYNPVCNFVSP